MLVSFPPPSWLIETSVDMMVVSIEGGTCLIIFLIKFKTSAYTKHKTQRTRSGEPR